MNKIDPEKWLTIQEAAHHSNVTRQAIYVALRGGGLKATKEENKWKIKVKDLDDYRLNKYNRDKSVINGEPLFDIKKGYLSVLHVSKFVGDALKRPYPPQRIYYLVRSGKLKSFKKGSSWIIREEDMTALINAELSNLQLFSRAGNQ